MSYAILRLTTSDHNLAVFVWRTIMVYKKLKVGYQNHALGYSREPYPWTVGQWEARDFGACQEMSYKRTMPSSNEISIGHKKPLLGYEWTSRAILNLGTQVLGASQRKRKEASQRPLLATKRQNMFSQNTCLDYDDWGLGSYNHRQNTWWKTCWNPPWSRLRERKIAI